MTPHLVCGQSNDLFFFGHSKEYNDVMVKKVLNANTIVLADDSSIQLIGLKAPPIFRKKMPRAERDEYGFVQTQEASPFDSIENISLRFTQELLEGQHVRLEYDKAFKSPEGQTLAYVFLLDSDLMANTEILRQGMAHLSIRPPNTKYAKALRAAYREARQEQRGLQSQ